ncbi:hypothetical protein J3D54_003618 [Pseudomonas sp. GGS8]|nr:hypothetical protein [Pseudomonas sp. GGS8]
MANPYRELFQAPGARAFMLAGMIARIPISMTGIGLITMLSQRQGGYGLAGSVAASSGWLVDAFGARSGFWVSIAAGAVVLGSAVQSFRHLK